MSVKKDIVVAMAIWNAIVAASIVGMHIWARKLSFDPLELLFPFIDGCGVVSLTTLLRGTLNRIPASMAGLGLGLILPMILGLYWSELPSHFPSLPWSPLDAWVNGMLLAIPSGIAGACIGFLQAKRPPRVGIT